MVLAQSQHQLPHLPAYPSCPVQLFQLLCDCSCPMSPEELQENLLPTKEQQEIKLY